VRGEIHEYQLHNAQLLCEGGALRLVADLWPATLGGAPVPDPDAAAKLAAAIADPAVQSFFVHLRMPRRFALVFELAREVVEGQLVLRVVPAPEEGGLETAERAIRFFQDGALVNDPSELSLVVQLT
jgi:hypothetical protein